MLWITEERISDADVYAYECMRGYYLKTCLRMNHDLFISRTPLPPQYYIVILICNMQLLVQYYQIKCKSDLVIGTSNIEWPFGCYTWMEFWIGEGDPAPVYYKDEVFNYNKSLRLWPLLTEYFQWTIDRRVSKPHKISCYIHEMSISFIINLYNILFCVWRLNQPFYQFTNVLNSFIDHSTSWNKEVCSNKELNWTPWFETYFKYSVLNILHIT